MIKAILATVCLLSLAAAQSASRDASQKPAAPGAKQEAAAKPSVTKEPPPTPEQKLARQMLDAASANTGVIPEADLRSFFYSQIASGYAKYDKKKERQALQHAFAAAVLAKQEGRRDAVFLQQQALNRLISGFGPDAVEEMLPQADAIARNQATSWLAEYYLGHKNLDRAVELLETAPLNPQFPYSAATDAMLDLPPARNADLLGIFARALEAYGAKDSGGHIFLTVPSVENDIGAMVVRFEHRLPPAVLLQAMDQILEDDKDSERCCGAMTMVYASGTVSFPSTYEFRVFQFLPVLKELDPTRAKSLLEEDAALRSEMQRFPEGTRSLDPSLSDTPDPAAKPALLGASYGDTANSPGQSQFVRQTEETRRAGAILDSAQKNPGTAILNAQRFSPNSAAELLIQIAGRIRESDPNDSANALDKVRLDGVDAEHRTAFFCRMARLYLKLGDREGAEND